MTVLVNISIICVIDIPLSIYWDVAKALVATLSRISLSINWLVELATIVLISTEFVKLNDTLLEI